MPNFDIHLRFGWKLHTFISLFFVPTSLILNLPLELIIALIGITLPITLFSSLLPDIDHNSSNTNEIFRYSLLATTMTIVATFLSNYASAIRHVWLEFLEAVPYHLTAGTIVIISSISGFIVVQIFDRFKPKHRGVTHSLFFSFLTTTVMVGICWKTQPVIATSEFAPTTGVVVGIYFLSGILGHLYLDGEL